MKKGSFSGLDFEIDKLTRSIENVITGESFATEVLPVSKGDIKQIKVVNGWLFNWKKNIKLRKIGCSNLLQSKIRT